jgi:hypothetical protein
VRIGRGTHGQDSGQGVCRGARPWVDPRKGASDRARRPWASALRTPGAGPRCAFRCRFVSFLRAAFAIAEAARNPLRT